MLALTWDDLALAGVFAVGAVVGVLLTVATVRAVALVLTRVLRGKGDDG